MAKMVNAGEAARFEKNRDAWAAAWLAQFGYTVEQREAGIRAVHAARNSVAQAQHMWKFQGVTGSGGFFAEQGYCTLTVSRSLASMDNRERVHLRLVDLLFNATDGGNMWLWTLRASLIYGDGKGSLDHYQIGPKMTWQALDERRGEDFLRNNLMSVDQVVSDLHSTVFGWDQHELGPALRRVIDEAKTLITPGGASSWMAGGDLPNTIFRQESGYPLFIGALPDGAALSYSGDGSMITIAPPGSGKTQCNVFPNLLSWNGPAVVLDVSGDIYEKTAAWRSANVGPVYRFSPLEPERSHRFNPLTFVRDQPDWIWEDSRLLAETMIVPSKAADPFWENEARIVVTAAIAYACYGNKPADRPMYRMLDVLFGGKAWDDMISALAFAVDVRVMTQHAASLGAMNEKTLSSVLQTARSSLSAWSGERIARATAGSDWSPADLRGPEKPTVYICVRPNEVESYLSLLRVFIGQHIRVLTGGDVPPHGAPPILFMLDELPRLKYMAPVDEALNIGRKYGLRLWMFAQSVGQLQASYENADGMIGSCAVRIYMNPSGADGLADRLSEELGYVDSALDNSRRKLVEATELAGPDYRDQQLVFGLGSKPAKVAKVPAWQQPELVRRMAL